jgi:serine/threonine-protein kinase
VKFRRHLPAAFDWRALFTPGSPVRQQHAQEIRQALRNLAIFVGAILAGYMIAAFVLFRAPIFNQTSTVPRVIGLSLDSARALLEKAQLKYRESDKVPHPTQPPNHVVWQDPPADVVVTAGTTIDLSLSSGPPRVLVPDVAGFDEGTARTLSEAAGLTVTTEQSQTAAPKGVVVNTRPPAGTALSPGRPVTLVVSVGAPTITVPDVVGLTLQEARTRIEQAGLKSGTTLRHSITTTDAAGVVVEQRPPAGTLSAPETAVDLVISQQTP